MITVLYLLLFVLAFVLMIVSLFYVRDIHRMKYYQELLIKIINNDDIIQESVATVCAAYGIEEGDLLNWISKRSKKE